MSAADYLPATLDDAQRFLRGQLASYPGRANVMLRCVLASAIVIVTSMTLQVPLLALSLIVVFYVTQSNVVVTRLVGTLFIVGSTLAIGCSILLLQFTFDYPMLRIVVASLLFFGSVYLMRILKAGIVFFVVAIVIIYVQSFVDVTDDAELLIRGVLWVWVAVNYSIVLTLVVNTLFLPAEPQLQLKAEMHRQLMAVVAHLDYLIGSGPSLEPITPVAVQQGALALQKLLKFAAMRDAHYREEGAYQLACIATVSRLYRATHELPTGPSDISVATRGALHELSDSCRALDEAIGAGRAYRATHQATPESFDGLSSFGVAAEMQRALDAFDNLAARASSVERPSAKEPMVVPDAFTNPAYARFSLKTLLAVLVCYVFYNATDWQGIHTIMLTCLIIALPSLGASAQRAVLRISGAFVGSALALFMVVFVLPHLDSIIGLLLISLPVIALGSWISAGSERISYAGVQIMFTFSLALLEQFGPTTNLTDIRDRMIGIVLGVGVSTLIQMSFWREGESDALRQKLAAMLRSVSAMVRADRSDAGLPAEVPYAQQQLQTWTALADCEAVLARVALEPNWQEGEHAQLTLHGQTVLAQGREIMLAGNALHNALSAPAAPRGEARDAACAIQEQAAKQLALYADDLSANPPLAQTPQRLSLRTLEQHGMRSIDIARGAADDDSYRMQLAGCARNLIRQLSGLPDWQVSNSALLVLRELHEND
ncbi:multidrug transporter (plasmid) [Burkholderia sp. PAMC 28687]|uniref:FUSC family protein n=1 Tax=Burkholderia sp. PAMC 28687 TaxID=1795874 RepID=UPI00078072CE|nr:FUSC family protein [Burkholderia sp. PAMC 28687]AMM18727.1 multidrug transporter [Burkholderia sp. PAMC 28687]